MLDNLRNPPEPFEDVIRTHFRLKGRSIKAQLNEWLSKDDNLPTQAGGGGLSCKASKAGSSRNGFAKDVEELRALLTKLEAD